MPRYCFMDKNFILSQKIIKIYGILLPGTSLIEKTLKQKHHENPKKPGQA